MGAERGQASPRSKVELRHRLNYQRVVLAVYVLADGATPLRCSATNGEIADECGLSLKAVRRALAEMNRRGVINTFDHRDGIAFRTHVFCDHPQAAELIDDFSWHGRYEKQGA